MSTPFIKEKIILNGEINSLLEQLSDHQTIKLICKLKSMSASEGNIKMRDEIDQNVLSFPKIVLDYEIILMAEAYNCFDNFLLDIYITFMGDNEAWLSFQKNISELIRSNKTVLVSTDIYHYIDGALCLYNPCLTPTNRCIVK